MLSSVAVVGRLEGDATSPESPASMQLRMIGTVYFVVFFAKLAMNDVGAPRSRVELGDVAGDLEVALEDAEVGVGDEDRLDAVRARATRARRSHGPGRTCGSATSWPSPSRRTCSRRGILGWSRPPRCPAAPGRWSNTPVRYGEGTGSGRPGVPGRRCGRSVADPDGQAVDLGRGREARGRRRARRAAR